MSVQVISEHAFRSSDGIDLCTERVDGPEGMYKCGQHQSQHVFAIDPDPEARRVPVTTIRGTDLLVGALEGLRKKITLGQLVEAQTRLGELLTAIQIDPAPFTVDDPAPTEGKRLPVTTISQDDKGNSTFHRRLELADDLEGPARARRSEHDLLVSLCQLGEEQLAEIKRLNTRLGTAAEERCSFEIDSNASAGKLKAKGKSYGPTAADAREAAHLEFVTEMAALEAAQSVGWAATLEALRTHQAAADV